MVQKISALAFALTAFALAVGAAPVPESSSGYVVYKKSDVQAAEHFNAETVKVTMVPNEPTKTEGSSTESTEKDNSSPESTEGGNSGDSEEQDTAWIFYDKDLDDSTHSLTVTGCEATFPNHPTSLTVKDIQSKVDLQKAVSPPFVATVPKVKIAGESEEGGKCLACYKLSFDSQTVYIVSANSNGSNEVFNVEGNAFDKLNGGSKDRSLAIQASIALVDNSKCGL